MPHFTLEYSGNLDSRVDMAKVVETVRKAAVETGIFPVGGIRVRAIRCEHYAIADGNPQLGFLCGAMGRGKSRKVGQRPVPPQPQPSCPSSPNISLEYYTSSNREICLSFQCSSS